MSRNPAPSSKRIVDAAIELFASQGFAATTTKQIADRAGVNEVTLFRNFGSKHDLLLAVVEDSGIFARLPEALEASAAEIDSLSAAVKYYARDRLHALEGMSELLRAFVGEVGQYSLEQRRAFNQERLRGTRAVARCLTEFAGREQVEMRTSLEKFASLLDKCLFGYLVADLTSEFQELWSDREEFIDFLADVCLYGAVSNLSTDRLETAKLSEVAVSIPSRESSLQQPSKTRVADLPAELVRSILQQAKKQGVQSYAIVYLLFGAGLLPEELVRLKRSQHICTSRQHLVQVEQGAARQVPINQWIMGKRYGSYANNPLSKWLKARKDEATTLFVTDRGEPLSESDLLALWQEATVGMLTPENALPRIEQARQTWCVEMLMKGMSSENLSIVSGWAIEQLRPYVQRAREKLALEQAIQLDRQQN
ncbi:transcriptional regulator [Rubidibacter lacunae KORDI 51-2]|uniref:Transcriptional regulator n=1 Tax=Rubidibacter lacunae KORDI 51-2 TaxID=582515 RepID=U5DAB0_9CHRO|nr:TetR/AcrR family transcriptional regulator [Rubidibacter lacunae]ERN41513.1 transcriptional regulator [Rubidibacter lacunae KORDI 51-2]